MCMQNRFQYVYSAFGTSLHISFLFPSSIAHWCPHVFFSCEAFGLGTSRKCSTVENISFEQEKGPYLEVVSLSCDSEHDSEWWSANQCVVRRCLCVSCPTSANWGHVIKANALSARTHCTIIISPLPLSMGFYMQVPRYGKITTCPKLVRQSHAACPQNFLSCSAAPGYANCRVRPTASP